MFDLETADCVTGVGNEESMYKAILEQLQTAWWQGFITGLDFCAGLFLLRIAWVWLKLTFKKDD